MTITNVTTVADIIRTYGITRSDHPALIYDETTVSWGTLYERSQRVATMLRNAGVGDGDRVALLDKNGLEHFELFFGAALLKAVLVDINWRLAPPEVQYIVHDSGAKVFVVGDEFRSVAETIAPDLPFVRQTLVVGTNHEQFESYAAVVDAASPNEPGTSTKGDDVVFHVYSSGTTGRPKGVLLTNDNLFALLPAAVDMWRFDESAVSLVAMPLFHVGGCGWALAAMAVGATCIVVREPDPRVLSAVIADRQITHAFLVPAVLRLMLMLPDIDSHDFSRLQVIVYGASPISDDVLTRAVERFGCDFWQAYGLTETIGAVVHLAPADHDPSGPRQHLLRSCGLPGPGAELRIVDTNTLADSPVGSVGEIWIRSGQVMKGYWNQPEETERAITADGWFRSGDIGYLDAEGYLFIHDRVKDMIVSGGENVYPAEVENVLMNHPDVADVAVIGIPDEKWGETVKAVAVRTPGTELSDEQLIAFTRANLARYKCPTSVDWVDVLPRNPSGKVLKTELRAPYWEGRDRYVS